MKVAVVGAAGYVGGELLRILLQHPEVSEVVATSRSQAGRPVAEVHPGLAALTEARFAGLTAGEASRAQDVVFLALEHGESPRLAAEVFESGPGLVVDLAADFRVRDLRLYERYYGAHPAAEFVTRFAYALADVRGAELRGATALAGFCLAYRYDLPVGPTDIMLLGACYALAALGRKIKPRAH